MTDPNHNEIFIIKRHVAHECDHHGGAWKIAFADFMTAMMALFLVLWLINSTSEKTKHTLAQYFNPVKLVDMTTVKKGFRDPKETEMGSGSNVTEAREESDKPRLNPPGKTKDDANVKADPNAPARTEAELFRDPYAVLAEIAASAPAQASKSSSGAAADAASTDAPGTFTDPFTTTPNEQEKPPEGLLPLDQSMEAQSKEQQGKNEQGKDVPGKDVKVNEARDVREQQRADSAASPQAPAQRSNGQPDEGLHTEQSQDVAHSAAATAAKLKTEIMNAINNSAHLPDLPHIEVQATREGILISLTDDAHYSMFAIGSAKPQPETVQIMEKIGQILKAGSDAIVIRGHTDGRPYKSAVYDNWRLSSARAHMALYMLARGGVSEKRIENVAGYADHHLKSPNNPNASENRRIEILLRKEKP